MSFPRMLLCLAVLIPAWPAQGRDQKANVKAETAAPPSRPQDHMALGNRLYQKEDYTGAAEQYRQAIRAKQSLPFAWFNLGNCHVQTKAYNKAVVAYTRSLEEAPTFSRPWLVLGDVYYTLGSVGEAMVCYRRVLELDGPNLHAFQLLGECALKAGDAAEALKNFEAALKMEPDQVDIYFAMAETHARIRDYESAQKVMENAILLSGSAPANAHFYLGRLYELDGQERKAVRAYEEGLSVDPKRTEYYLRIAGLHETKGDDFLALLILEQALDAGIKRPEILVQRGVIFFRQKRYDKALEHFRSAYAMGDQKARQGIENVAAAFYNAGEKEKAENLLKEMKQ